MDVQHHAVIGLPEAGKTTFLAALWHLLTSREMTPELELDELHVDRTYLNDIARIWQRCEEMPRTVTGAENTVAIHIRARASGHQMVLWFPDLSGEIFERQFETRTCAPDYVSLYERNGGVMLFVSAEKHPLTPTVTEVNAIAGAITNGEPAQQIEWRHSFVSQDAQLVDLLQFLQRPPFRIARRRLALIVSAWDVRSEPDLGPEVWLAQEFPLLEQFLRTNQESFDHRAYAVSAQGGRLKTEEQRELLRRKTPSERIECQGPESRPHDLTVPILWLSGGT